MTLAVLGQRAPRVTVVNVTTRERLVANASPPSFAWSVGVSWARLEVPGRSTVPLQYGLTQNPVVSTFELVFDRRLPETAGGTQDVVAVQRFLRALTVPASEIQAPPGVLLVWPNLITFEGVVTSLSIEHRELRITGGPLLMVATLAIEGAASRAGQALLEAGGFARGAS
jgi:hypothetical protein